MSYEILASSANCVTRRNPCGAKDRHENHKRSPRSRGTMDVRLIDQGEFSQEEQVMEEGYQSPKNHCPESADNPDQYLKKRQ